MIDFAIIWFSSFWQWYLEALKRGWVIVIEEEWKSEINPSPTYQTPPYPINIFQQLKVLTFSVVSSDTNRIKREMTSKKQGYRCLYYSFVSYKKVILPVYWSISANIESLYWERKKGKSLYYQYKIFKSYIDNIRFVFYNSRSQ